LHIAAIAVSAILLVLGYVFLFKSLNEQFELQHEINAMLPSERKFEPLFWGLGTRIRFRQLQKELLPDSPRYRRYRMFGWIGLSLMLSGLISLLMNLAR
jgi:hypothetical protein